MTWLEPKMFLTFRFGQLYENIRRQARKDNVIDFVLLSEEFGGKSLWIWQRLSTPRRHLPILKVMQKTGA